MQIQIKATNFSLTPAIQDYVEKKIGALDKFLTGIPSDSVRADVEVERTTRHHKDGDELFRAEVNLRAGSIRMRTEESNADLYAAIDIVRDEMERQIISGKQRKTSIIRRGATRLKQMLRGDSPKDAADTEEAA